VSAARVEGAEWHAHVPTQLPPPPPLAELASLVNGSIHSRLYASVKEVEERGKKVTRKNQMKVSFADMRVTVAANWLFNYNTVRG
jgi:hypothetical protein